MTTARDAIENALKDLQRVAAGETMAAEDAVDGLKRLNRMMVNIANRSGDTSWVDVALTDNIPVRAEHIPAIEHLLVRWLAPMHGDQLSSNQADLAKEADRTLSAGYFDMEELDIDEGLTDRTRRVGRDRI